MVGHGDVCVHVDGDVGRDKGTEQLAMDVARLSGLAWSVITTLTSFRGKSLVPSYAAQERVKTYSSMSYAVGLSASRTFCLKASLFTASHHLSDSSARSPCSTMIVEPGPHVVVCGTVSSVAVSREGA